MLIKKIPQFIKNNLYLTIFIVYSILVSIFLIWYLFFIGNASLDSIIKPDGKTEEKFARQLDGVYVDKDKTDLRPVVVMIENHYDSRPPAGLEQASIIYETIIEGDITRFLAIFDLEIEAKKIGPVRSTRPFFVDIAQEWDGIYFHAGDSQEALDQLKSSDIDRVDEVSADGVFFWRDLDRYPPHNLFTSSDLIERAINAKGFSTTTDFSPWLFKDGQGVAEPEADIKVDVDFFDNPLYQVGYIYNPEDNNYTRYLSGTVHKTQSGIILKTDNIVKHFVDSKIIDSYGRRSINLDNGGEAIIYQDGREIDGYWEKVKGRTRFFDNNDEEIKFNRGRIWVELIFN